MWIITATATANTTAATAAANSNNSIQFSGYLVKWKLNSTSDYYKASIKTQIKHKNLRIYKYKTLNGQNTKIRYEKQYKL
jgi:hypothetical protein